MAGKILFLTFSVMVMFVLSYSLPADEFKAVVFQTVGQDEDMVHLRAGEEDENDISKRIYRKPFCRSGFVKSKYCTIAAKHCFPQRVTVHFRPAFPYGVRPKVMVGLTLIDAYRGHNVRVNVVIERVTRTYFRFRFHPWDRSITYQLGVHWMACP